MVAPVIFLVVFLVVLNKTVLITGPDVHKSPWDCLMCPRLLISPYISVINVAGCRRIGVCLPFRSLKVPSERSLIRPSAGKGLLTSSQRLFRRGAILSSFLPTLWVMSAFSFLPVGFVRTRPLLGILGAISVFDVQCLTPASDSGFLDPYSHLNRFVFQRLRL